MDYSILSRSYDLRGIYRVDIDDDFYYRLGYAFAKVTGAARIVLGYDARLSSPTLKNAFTRWVSLAGSTIIDIWLCSSDMLSFATCHYDDIDAGVMITASHNPKEYNGMKSLAHTGEPYNLKKYGADMAKIMEDMAAEKWGMVEKIEQRNVLSDWITHIYTFLTTKNFSQMKIVCDGWNGSAWAFVEALCAKWDIDLIPLFLTPDGEFPNHHPNPMLEKNREDAKQAILDQGAQLAFIFDGDADRVIVLDETWEQINSAILSAIIAESILTKEPSANFCGNAVASHNFRDFVEERWSRYVREMVGHVYIRETMMHDRSIAFAGEHSAHYFLRDNYFMDSWVVAGMIFLDLLVRSWQTASEFTAAYKRYITLEETNFEVRNPKAAIARLAEIYKSEKYDLFDGITVEYVDGSWWNFRPSSNEPLLRFNMEGKTQERFDALYAEIMVHIRSFGEASED